jgi:hypothetical protein
VDNKPNLPEDVPYSWRASVRAGGGWMMLAFLTDLPGLYLIGHYKEWPLTLRTVMALIPLIATLLYARSTARWVRGMDELHRRLALEAFLFSTVAYLFLTAAWFLLKQAGVWGVIAQRTGLHLEGMSFANCTTIICLTYVFFGVGYSIFKRRYE